MVRSRAWCLGFVLALVLAVTGASEAWAHASLLETTPMDGAVLPAPPSTLMLTFNEPVSPLVMRLVAPDGSAIIPKVAAENDTVTLTPPPLRRGTHVLSWRVISADGHPVGGSLMFSIGAPSAPPLAGVQQGGDPAVYAALWATKVAIYLGLFVGIGGAFFLAWFADKLLPSRGWPIAVLGVGLVAAIYSVSFQGLDALGLPFMDALDPKTWAAGFDTSYGLTATAATLALLAGLVSLAFRAGAMARVLSLAGLCGAALALALSGHAATASPRLVTTPSVFLHVLCVAFWIGALVPLIAAVRACDRVTFARFSRAIPYPLALIVVTGFTLAFVQLDRVDALWTTNYGLVLSGKLAVVLALLLLAAANRYWFTPRFAARDASVTRTLTISMAVELALVCVILALVGLWRFTPPPRALVATEPVSIHFHGEHAMAQIDLTPERARGAHVSIDVLDGDFKPLVVKEVTLAFSSPTIGIEPIRRAAAHAGGTLWQIDNLRIPVAGRWQLRVEILIDDFDKVTLEDDVELPRTF